MSVDYGGSHPMEESANCVSVFISFKTRRQANLGAKNSNVSSTSDLKELRKKSEAALKENDAQKAKKYQPQKWIAWAYYYRRYLIIKLP